MKAVILAAGIGSRLGKGVPKCLTELPTGETIIERQTHILRKYVEEIIVVVGFKKELIMEMNPQLLYVYNTLFTQNNTAKSLLCALDNFSSGDILWMNGDVVFEEAILDLMVKESGNACAVQYTDVDEEEIKFTLDESGYIKELNKTMNKGLGEGVGINKVTSQDLLEFKKSLAECGQKDYFERAIELSYSKNIKFKPVDVSSYKCLEVDFIEDLQKAWKLFELTK